MEYDFVDSSQQLEVSRTESVHEYSHDPHLGTDVEVAVIVKWANQLDHDEYRKSLTYVKSLGKRGAMLDANIRSSRCRHAYFAGFIARTSLKVDFLSPETTDCEPALQPASYALDEGGFAVFACANQLIVSSNGKIGKEQRVIGNDMFARLHSVDISEDGERALVTSSSMDMIYEVKLSDGLVVWSMDMWSEAGLRVNKSGQSFYRNSAEAPSEAVRNPSSFDLIDDSKLTRANCVIDNPGTYNGLGLATRLLPVFPNGAYYETDSTILVTSFNRGEAWRIDRCGGTIEIIASDLGNPHEFRENKSCGGYMVADTLREKVIFIDRTLCTEVVYDLSGFEGRKRGLDSLRWLQTATELGPNLYCSVMGIHQMIVLFDPDAKSYRCIPFDANWGVQSVMTYPSGA